MRTGSSTPEDDAARRRLPRTWVDVGAAVLLLVAGLLVGASLLTAYAAHRREVASPGVSPPDWLYLFDVNSEANVPTWFTVALMVAAATAALGAAAVTRHSSRRGGRFYTALAVILLALSLDELAGLHERLSELGATLVGGSALHFTWAVPGAVLAVVLLVSLVLGARTLPAAFRGRLLLAFATFFAGALITETVGGQVFVAEGHRAAYLLVTAVEEFLEMAGVVLVLRAVLSSVQLARSGDAWVVGPVTAGRA